MICRLNINIERKRKPTRIFFLYICTMLKCMSTNENIHVLKEYLAKLRRVYLPGVGGRVGVQVRFFIIIILIYLYL